MRIFVILFLLLTALIAKDNSMNIYDFNVTTIESKEISMSKYKDKVLLIVNVASECAFTPQYEGLEKLYQTYKDQGFMVLAFPCNQFSNQESAPNEKIKFFCVENYDVHFDMFSKVDVNGKSAIALYKHLKEQKGGFVTDAIKWNFTKFLVDRDGNIVDRFSPTTKPKDIAKYIEKLLKK